MQTTNTEDRLYRLGDILIKILHEFYGYLWLTPKTKYTYNILKQRSKQ